MIGAPDGDHNRAWIERRIEAAPYWRLLGVALVGLDHGYARLRIRNAAQLRNRGGGAHGGVYASLVDAAATCAALTTAAAGDGVATLDLTVSYLAPAISPELVAEGWVLRRGGSLLACEVDIHTGEGRRLGKSLAQVIFTERSRQGAGAAAGPVAAIGGGRV